MEIVRVRNGMFSTNTYLIGDNDGCYVIDPSDDYIRIKRTIDERFFGKVKGILLGTFTEMEETECKPDIITLLKEYVAIDMPIAVTKEIGHGVDSKAIVIGQEMCL